MNSFIKNCFLVAALVVLGAATRTSAQIQIGSTTAKKNPGKISEEKFSDFKKTTTYFILQERDYAKLNEYKTAISKVWTVTPFEIIKPGDIGSKDLTKSSFFFFGGFVTVRQGKGGSGKYIHLSYDLFTLEENKKGKIKQKLFAKFMLHLDMASFKAASSFANNINTFGDKIQPYLYQKAEMTNWNPLFLSGYLKEINDDLTREEGRSVFDETTNKAALAGLANGTLYIPTYVNTKMNAFTGQETDKEEDEGTLKSNYPYPAEYIDAAELSRKVETGEIKTGYYLSYIKSTTDKFVSVFDIATREMIYSNYTMISYNFKLKDLKKLGSKVK